jgi:hypothetical protein
MLWAPRLLPAVVPNDVLRLASASAASIARLARRNNGGAVITVVVDLRGRRIP